MLTHHAPRRTPQELMPGIAAIDDATEEKAQHHPYHPPLLSPIRIFHPRLRTTPLPSSVSCARLLLPGTSCRVTYAGGGGADRAAPHRGQRHAQHGWRWHSRGLGQGHPGRVVAGSAAHSLAWALNEPLHHHTTTVGRAAHEPEPTAPLRLAPLLKRPLLLTALLHSFYDCS